MNMQVANMVSADTRVTIDGSVVGVMPYVENFKGFSSKQDEQQGNYFPLKLTKTGNKMTIKKNGVAEKGRTNMKFDPEIVLRVENKETTFEIEVDGKHFITLNFRKAALLSKEDE